MRRYDGYLYDAKSDTNIPVACVSEMASIVAIENLFGHTLTWFDNRDYCLWTGGTPLVEQVKRTARKEVIDG